MHIRKYSTTITTIGTYKPSNNYIFFICSRIHVHSIVATIKLYTNQLSIIQSYNYNNKVNIIIIIIII